jgi:hypothetical protein
MVPKKDTAKQKNSFDTLLKQWGRVSVSKTDKILKEREPAEPEAARNRE